MNNHSLQDWQKLNQHSLITSLNIIKKALECKAGKGIENDKHSVVLEELPATSALRQLCNTFGLSTFETEVLLLCAGMELDATFPSLCAIAQADPQKPYPTFSLALSIFSNPHWSAITPNAPLRRWRLIEVGGGTTLTLSPLRIDERILHYLAGVQHLDERLVDIVQPLSETNFLVKSHQELAEKLAETLANAAQSEHLPVVQLCGEDVSSKRAIAVAACEMLKVGLHLLVADHLPSNANEINQLLRLWEREAVLSNSALLLDCDEAETLEKNTSAIARIIEHINSPLIVTSRERFRQRQRPLINIDVYKPTHQEQRDLWQDALGEMAEPLTDAIESLVAQFNLNAPSITAACASTLGQEYGENNSHILTTSLWDSCRTQARPRLEDLAQRIEVGAGWEDLVLPETQMETLNAIIAHVRQRAKVYESWGFAGKGGRGLGISALFAGASGTGKTTAAEVIAGELKLDLYRIDLSSVVSKYIGETEKNLRRVFDAAETGGAILLFDEADALFGKRSDVKDSHDRHANIEVSYLLQRMEAYRGLAILTTNIKGALDNAFLRRIRFVVQFPFPDATQRAEIWRRVFPSTTPTENLDVNKLAKLSVAGGNIRNIALNAAFLAADANESVSMKHLLSAARSESAKLEKPLIDSEVKGWC
ncbi:ATPase [[Phormidium ambiguum] IAM M-71]|uniref:ATPase n=1 Tax=[Phormidium ambiguum] IAM M-71 TaxID=454136 RepID=A0A1U7IQT0_9CYAN|nr:ATP-binding protein [Phormidium ambiguum]OKH39728.1 ATPase [Phormidium ambiguum IAM M-71]